jgi:hypothetical protein
LLDGYGGFGFGVDPSPEGLLLDRTRHYRLLDLSIHTINLCLQASWACGLFSIEADAYMITIDDATTFLLDSRLIGLDAVIDGDLEITSTTRRNRNLQISYRHGGVMLKQPHDNMHESADSLRREAKFYRYCDRLNLLNDLIPTLIYVKESDGLLLVELFKDALPLWRYYRQRGHERFPAGTAGALGTRLSQFHRQARTWRTQEMDALGFLQEDLPFAFTLHCPHPNMLSYLSGGSNALIESLQSDSEACALLNALRERWSIEAVIHGDIKMDNVLVLNPNTQEESGVSSIRLIDWEMAQWGDPAWDVAGVFQDFVFWWVISMPQHDDRQRMAAESGFPIQSLRAGANAFWRCYRADMDCATAHIMLRKAISFAACRMVQTAYEIASRFDHIPTPSSILLQAGINLLKDPERGIEQFFSLDEVTAYAA